MSTTTTRYKTLLFIIAVLLISNIALVVYVFTGGRCPHKPPTRDQQQNKSGITSALEKEVGFSEQQLAQYKNLREEHWKIAKPLFDSMQKGKELLFKLTQTAAVEDSVVQNAAASIAANQKLMELQSFRHFKQVRELCTREQLPRYDSVLKKIVSKRGKPQQPQGDQKK